MGYKMPIVCKEIYLPVPYNETMTIAEYKERYGIDLKEFIMLSSNNIYLAFPSHTKVFLVVDTDDYSTDIVSVGIPNISEHIAYVSGTANGVSTTGVVNQDAGFGFYLVLKIDKDNDFSYDSVEISYSEI